MTRRDISHKSQGSSRSFQTTIVKPHTTAVATILLIIVPLGGCVSGPAAQPQKGDRAPLNLTDLEVRQVEPDATTIAFRLQGSAEEIVVRYHVEGAPDWNRTKRPAETGAMTVRLVGLHANTSYVASVEAQADGGVHTSDEIRWTTPARPNRNNEPGVGDGEIWIRPGMKYYMPDDTWCTLGFILRSVDNETLYGLTAGHCLDGKHGPVLLGNGTEFGRVATYIDGGAGEPDWGAIRVHPGFRAHISPGVEYWSGPTGVATEVDTDDVICYYGNGPTGSSLSDRLRDGEAHRCAHFERYRHRTNAVDEAHWRPVDIDPTTKRIAGGWTEGGDSGGPVIHYETGEALGVIIGKQLSVLPTPGYSHFATTVDSIMEEMENRGYNLTLMTADYEPPPSDTTRPPGPAS